MSKVLCFLVILGLLSTTGTLASRCYSDFCHNKTIDLKNYGQECLITPIQRGKDCSNLSFEKLGRAAYLGPSLGKFRLSAYVKDFGKFRGRTTAFNLSISEIQFDRLITRYQDSGDNRHVACREIEIYRKDSNVSFPELFVSCPFAEETEIEGITYRLEYLVVGSSYEYSKKLVFIVPRHTFIDENVNDVKTFTPFVYVDVSDISTLSLHIQPLPKKFNVTEYKVWLINNDTNSVVTVDLSANDEKEIQHNFTITRGIHYLKVAAMHPSCGEYGCVNSTSPLISTKPPTRRLLIMIISVVWIPPVVIYGMYYAYKMYKKHTLAKRGLRRLNCLLVYSPTHVAHVNVMEKLALYMRSCNINAMIDTLSIPNTTKKDPGLWCNEAFELADVIIVATSPPPSGVIVPVIYHNMDNHALRLLKENYCRRNKRYYVVQFPYCNDDDIPAEARLFRRFDMPQELDKLIRNIYGVDRVRFFGVNKRQFEESIESAINEIKGDKLKETTPNIIDQTDRDERPNFSKDLQTLKAIIHEHEQRNETDGPIERKVGRIHFTTNIEDLYLLGEPHESDTTIYIPPHKEYLINQLTL